MLKNNKNSQNCKNVPGHKSSQVWKHSHYFYTITIKICSKVEDNIFNSKICSQIPKNSEFKESS